MLAAPTTASVRRTSTLLAAVVVLALAAVLVGACGSAWASPADQAVAYQLGPEHSGYIADGGLSAPLTEQWSIALPAAISYPLIVNGRVYVTTANRMLYALSQASGAIAWSHQLDGLRPIASVTYDRGLIFAVDGDGLVTAFDAANGSVRWSRALPVRSVSSPPTAARGIVYVGAQGVLFALRGRDGRVLWYQPVLYGDNSSPAVDSNQVYVSYSCQQVFGFDRVIGAPAWHHGGCAGGGGRTPVVAAGRVYAREAALGDNIVLSAASGDVLGAFTAGPAPAIGGGSMYALSGSTLAAISDSGLGTNRWLFSGDSMLTTAPLLVGSLVFIGSSAGMLFAVDAATGTSLWSANAGAAIPGPDEVNVSQPLTGLAAANGMLVVPAGSRLVAYRTAGAIAAPPANSAPPTVDGLAKGGEVLAADVGIWSGLPSGYGYEWQRCDAAGDACTTLPGATDPTYAVVAADTGATLRVRVAATNAIGTSPTVASAPSAVVTSAAPVNDSPPEIIGIAAQDTTLIATVGAWSGDPASYAIRWQRCTSPSLPICNDIAGATTETYLVSAEDIGQQLVVRVVATNAGGDSDPVNSAATATVTGPVAVNQVPPSFSGFLAVDESLHADLGTWSGSPTSFKFQWFSCSLGGVACPDIAGATGQTYVIGPALVGRFVGVEVTATNFNGDSEPAASDAYGPVGSALARIVSYPTVNGAPQVGVTLSAGYGTWSGSPTGYSVQWYGCDATVTACAPIPGATTTTYRLGSADVGRRVGIGVVATNAGGDSYEEFSDLTEIVRAAAPQPQPQPQPPAPPLNSFATLSTRVRADGTVEISVRSQTAGKFTAEATAAAAILARGCLGPCSRAGRAVFGRASRTAKATTVIKLIIRPSARARRALAKTRRLRVRVKVTFRPALGGAPRRTVRVLTVKGSRRPSGAQHRIRVRIAARHPRPLGPFG